MSNRPKGYGVEFKITKGMKLPESRRQCKPLKYPWDKMEVGDSILVTGTFEQRHNARCSSYYWGKRNKMLFTTRVEGKEGLRIWRTK